VVRTARTQPLTPVRPRAPTGLELGRYRLGRRLGAGAYGVVFQAYDERLGRDVALKRLSLPGAGGEARAQREAVAAARLSHPAIVALYEARASQDGFVLVSELVRGHTLAALLEAGAVDDELTLAVGRSLCAALAHAHERGVVHRDVKPQNVIVPDDPPAGVAAKLTDFGIAWLADEEPLTHTGDVVGTFAYMAPEQVQGEAITEAADVYALGVVLYECLTGENPIRRANPAATARRIGRRLPPLHRRRPDLPRALCEAIDAAVEPRPSRRGALAELRAGLEGEREWPPLAPRPSLERPVAQASRPPRTTLPLVLRLAAGGLAAAVACAGLTLLSRGPLPPPELSALVVFCAVAAAPRVGWLAGLVALLTWLSAEGRAGAGALVLFAVVPAAIVLARRGGPGWSVPALAPLLGLAGLAGAYPALAGRAQRWWERAALGAAGGWGCMVLEPLARHRLWLGAAHGSRGAAAVRGHLGPALDHALAPALCTGTLLAMALWALAALVLPLLVRGRSLLGDLLGVGLWVAALAAGAVAIERLQGSGLPGGPPRGLALGLALGALLALGVGLARSLRSRSMALR
jgi:hypothetical protein